MPIKICRYSNFSQTRSALSTSFRPDHDEQIAEILEQHPTHSSLARGQGLSYSDCHLTQQGYLLDTRRLNRILSFDRTTGIVVCQPAVSFADLLQLAPNYLPPILPGHLQVTLAGGIANDVHGKNNHQAGSLGQHIIWLELQIGTQRYHCSKDSHSELFYATIGGVGLTGVMTRLAIQLKPASQMVQQTTTTFQELLPLLETMQSYGVQHDYQVAWLDLLRPFHAVLQVADHIEPASTWQHTRKTTLQIPPLPCRLTHTPMVKLFNRLYYHSFPRKPSMMPIWQFNNPLEKLNHWSRLYGKQGLLQFQAVFPVSNAGMILHQIQQSIQTYNATATLAVLKYFTQKGSGLLSFTQPGFCIAIDFVNHQNAIHAIKWLNQLMADSKGIVYLAKDLHLTPEQFQTMYPSHSTFIKLMDQYQSPMRSELSQRLRLQPLTTSRSALAEPTQVGESSRYRQHTKMKCKKPVLPPAKRSHASRTWIILGATSAIAEAFARIAAKAGYSLLLVGRQQQTLQQIAADLQCRYQMTCEILTIDFTQNIDLLRHLLSNMTIEFDLLVAQSLIVDNQAVTNTQITDLITVNITNTINLIHAYWNKQQQQHHIVFLSSVAATRGRAKNSLYGASKAAIEVYLQGLQQSATDKQHITIAKLGYIDTHQTYGKPGIFYAATPNACAKACWRSMIARKHTFYYPFFWSIMMLMLRAIPWSIYRKLQQF